MTNELGLHPPRQRRAIVGVALAALLALDAACASTPPPVVDDEPRADPPSSTAAAAEAPPKSKQLQEGEALVKDGKYQEAMAPLKKALAAEPRSAPAAFYLALCIEQTNGDKKEAERLYKQSLSQDPKLLEAAMNLAAFYLGEPPRVDEAIAVLDKSLSYNPGDPGLLTNLGLAFAKKKDFDRAFKAYSKALEKSDTTDLRLAIGTLLFENKRAEEAVPHLLKVAAAKNDDAATLATVGRMLGPGKAFNDCVRVFDRAIALKSDEAELYVRRGVCKHELKNEGEAAKDFEAAMKVDAKYQPAHYYAGLSYLAQGKKGLAKDALKRAYNLGKDSPIGKLAKQKVDTIR